MPFRSQAQAQFLKQNYPDIYKKWQAESPVDIRTLPETVTKQLKYAVPKQTTRKKVSKYDGRSATMRRLGLKMRDML